jgi:hypothetical protein
VREWKVSLLLLAFCSGEELGWRSEVCGLVREEWRVVLVVVECAGWVGKVEEIAQRRMKCGAFELEFERMKRLVALRR